MAKFSFLSVALSFFAMICANSIHQGFEQSNFPSSSKGHVDRACALFVHNTPNLQVFGTLRPSKKLGGFACRDNPSSPGVFRKHLYAKLLGSWRQDNKKRGLTLLQGASGDLSSQLAGPSNRSSEQETQDNAAYNRGIGGREMDPLHRPIIEKLREASQSSSGSIC